MTQAGDKFRKELDMFLLKEGSDITQEDWIEVLSYLVANLEDKKSIDAFMDGLPEVVAKFKVGDVLLAKADEYQANPTRFEVSDIKQGCYCFKDYKDKPINDIDRDYINERDVLWYFEGKSLYSNEWKILCGATRQTIPNIEKLYKGKEEVMFWKPIYNLGFKLKDN